MSDEKLTEAQKRERAVLTALGQAGEDFGYLTFKGIARRSQIEPSFVRRTVRRLARKGLAEYGRGLWSEDGEPAGSGYAITPAGRRALDENGHG